MNKISKITVRQVVDHIGRKNLAEALELAGDKSIQPAVSTDSFPASWYPVVKKLAKERGLDVPDSLFNWKSTTTDIGKQAHNAA